MLLGALSKSLFNTVRLGALSISSQSLSRCSTPISRDKWNFFSPNPPEVPNTLPGPAFNLAEHKHCLWQPKAAEGLCVWCAGCLLWLKLSRSGKGSSLHTCFLKRSTWGPKAWGSASFTNQTTSSTVQVKGFLLDGRAASCRSGEGLEAVGTKKPTKVHYKGTQKFPWFVTVSVQGFGSLTAALDVGSVRASISRRWWCREKRGLAAVSNLTAYWKTWSQLVNCVKKHETLKSLLGKEKCASCQALKPSCPCSLICSSRDLG